MSHTAPIVLSDLIVLPRALNRARVRDAVLVLSAALFTALCAQVTVSLGFTPVPLTGQTFAVLCVGGILGSRRAMASQGLYWALGAIGLPFYSSASGGWTVATGATFGYFIGFVLAFLVSLLANKNLEASVFNATIGCVLTALLFRVFRFVVEYCAKQVVAEKTRLRDLERSSTPDSPPPDNTPDAPAQPAA